MRKIFYIFIFTSILSGDLYPAVRHMDFALSAAGALRNDPLTYVASSAFFPDTLCLVSAWTPGFRGYGIQEGYVYGGSHFGSLSFKTQYHHLMSNHDLSIGIPLLREEQIRAGVRLTYGLSSIHGVETLHGGSCSGAVNIRPHPHWDIFMQTEHCLSFPQDKSIRFFEPVTSVRLRWDPGGPVTMNVFISKQEYLPWEAGVLIAGSLWDTLYPSLLYAVPDGRLVLTIRIRIGRFNIHESLAYHPYLGITQSVFIAYAY